MDLTADEQARLKLIDETLAAERALLKIFEDPDAIARTRQQIDVLGREKSRIIGKKGKLGPGELNKRDRRAIRRIRAGKTVTGTVPAKRLEKIMKAEPDLIKTYVYTMYRGTEPSDCQCCPDGTSRDKRGHGHIFCHAIHDLKDQHVSKLDLVQDAIDRVNLQDGDEFEVIIRRTGRRPFGDRLMLSYPGVKNMVREPKVKKP
jgi:hypothetical protein